MSSLSSRVIDHVAGGVGLEGPGDERPAYRIDLDGADFAAVLDLADVPVAERRLADRAAGLGLLDGALHDFVGEVARVELGDRAHDPVQQQPARRLVDVLGAGDERRARGLRMASVISTSSARLRASRSTLCTITYSTGFSRDVGEHPLQFGPAGAAGALASVDELLDHDGPERAVPCACRPRAARGSSSPRGRRRAAPAPWSRRAGRERPSQCRSLRLRRAVARLCWS